MRYDRVLLLVIACAFAVITIASIRRTSTTFDEILLPSAGARGYATGKFDLVTDHPPLLQYVYGLPVFLSRPNYPKETVNDPWSYDYRYGYAQAFFWLSGNNPERLAFLARLMGVAIGVLLIGTTYLYTRAHFGPRPALVAAALVAFVPDVLAHSGISYNDVPLALILLVAGWALDAAFRKPTLRRTVLAATATGLALGVKFSAIVLGPIAVLLLLLEGGSRWPDRAWLRAILRSTPVFVVVTYLVLVGVYLGDFTLRDFWVGLEFNIRHANLGHGAPAVLLGDRSATGWWYFFPVAFFLKTSAGLHVLLALALVAPLLLPLRARWRELAAAPLRMPVVCAVMLLVFVMAADLNIGFRHALPIIPLACIMIAVGVVRIWDTKRPLLQGAVVVALAWHIIAPLRFYPFFLSYLSEYTGPVESSYETLVDSSLDWGQGLLELRDFMREEQIPRVMLSYFGSALPHGYGIDYVALPSFFPLGPDRGLGDGEQPPRWLAVSATNVAGNYLEGDPFARFRNAEPYRVLARSIFVYRLEER
jgi:4-amino-4-deoxy-L-arabinose transferase-like glycosyltransferase